MALAKMSYIETKSFALPHLNPFKILQEHRIEIKMRNEPHISSTTHAVVIHEIPKRMIEMVMEMNFISSSQFIILEL